MGRCSDNKAKLIAAALAMMVERPFSAITVGDLCEKGGVKTGSFYYFFATKTALGVTAFDFLWDWESKPELDRSFATDASPMLRFSRHLESVCSCQSTKEPPVQRNRWPLIWAACTAPGQEVEIAAKLRELFSLRCAYYEAAIQEAIATAEIPPCDVRSKAVALAGLIDGVLIACRVMGDPSLVRGIRAAGMDILRSTRNPSLTFESSSQL